MPGGHDALTDGKRGKAAATRFIEKSCRWRIRRTRAVPGVRTTQNRAVFGDDPVEYGIFRKNFLQFTQLTASCKDQLSSRRTDALQSFHGARRTTSIVGNCSIVITDETEVAHAWLYCVDAC